VHVCTDKDGRVIKPPPELRKLLKQMEEMSSDEHSKE
jgi:acyl-CoA thioesterase FadM